MHQHFHNTVSWSSLLLVVLTLVLDGRFHVAWRKGEAHGADCYNRRTQTVFEMFLKCARFDETWWRRTQLHILLRNGGYVLGYLQDPVWMTAHSRVRTGLEEGAGKLYGTNWPDPPFESLECLQLFNRFVPPQQHNTEQAIAITSPTTQGCQQGLCTPFRSSAVEAIYSTWDLNICPRARRTIWATRHLRGFSWLALSFIFHQ